MLKSTDYCFLIGLDLLRALNFTLTSNTLKLTHPKSGLTADFPYKPNPDPNPSLHPITLTTITDLDILPDLKGDLEPPHEPLLNTKRDKLPLESPHFTRHTITPRFIDTKGDE